MSQPREDPLLVRMWAVWEPVDAAANPQVPAGDYGAIRFALYPEVSATTLTSVEWTFQGNATTGRWRASARTGQVAALLPRIILSVTLDGATCRLTSEQVHAICWRGALLQLPGDRYGVVCLNGVLRRAHFSRLVPLTAQLPAAGTNAAVQDQAMDLDDILLPGVLPGGAISPGIRTLDDLARGDRERMEAVAAARHRAATAPTYAIRLPEVAPPAPNPLPGNLAQGPPVVAAAVSAYERLAPDISVGTQWNASLFVGSSLIFERATLEMVRPGFVRVVSGRNAGQDLEWPSPPATNSGLPIRFEIHSGPTRPAERVETSAYDALTPGILSSSDLLTWGLFLDAVSEDDVEHRIYQLRMFLERSFSISPTDVLSKLALLRDDLLVWGRRCNEVEWRSSPSLLIEGRLILRKLRLAHMERQGYDVSSLTPTTTVKDDIEKERARQDGTRRQPRHDGGRRNQNSSASVACFTCKQQGHISRNCPSRQQKSLSTPPASAPTSTNPANSGRLPYSLRECAYCFEHGLKYKGHFSDACYVKNPGLRNAALPQGFPSGGVPLRK